MSMRGRRGYARQRFLALVSLAATGILAIAVIAFLVGNAGYLFVGLVGFVLAIAGAWWFITERMPRRALGVLAAVAGVGLQIAALVQVTSRGDQIALRLAVVIGLLAVTVLTARAALSEDLHQEVTQQFRRAAPPRHPVLLCNPWSGGGKVEKFGLEELASSLGVRTIMLDHGLDLGQLARDAVAQGADCLFSSGAGSYPCALPPPCPSYCRRTGHIGCGAPPWGYAGPGGERKEVAKTFWFDRVRRGVPVGRPARPSQLQPGDRPHCFSVAPATVPRRWSFKVLLGWYGRGAKGLNSYRQDGRDESWSGACGRWLR